MIKKIFNVIIVVAFIIATIYGYNKFNEYINTVNKYKNLYALQTKNINKLNHTLFVKDSMFLIKTNELNKLYGENKNIRKKFDNIMHKYNMLEDTYIKIKAQRDSAINLKFDVANDSVDNNKYNFTTSFDLFTIAGSYGCSPKFINATLKQSKPIVLNIGIYKNNNKYMAIVKSNSKLLQFDWAYVDFHRKNNILDKTEISFGVPLNHFGFNSGIYYNNYGIQYTKFVDDYNIIVVYKSSIRNLWNMIR